MPGVAYTIGSRTHKEIHFSLNHIDNSAIRATDEIRGVLTHEMVLLSMWLREKWISLCVREPMV